MTPLLTSGDIVLSGKTFSRPDTGHQWFDELTVSNKGKIVLDVTTANGKTQVKLDGKAVSAGKVCTTPFLAADPLVPCTHSRHASWRVAGQRKRRGDHLR